VLVLVYSKTGVLQAWVKGSTWIPIFDVDTSVDLGGLSKKVSNFVMGMPCHCYHLFPDAFFFLV